MNFEGPPEPVFPDNSLRHVHNQP